MSQRKATKQSSVDKSLSWTNLLPTSTEKDYGWKYWRDTNNSHMFCFEPVQGDDHRVDLGSLMDEIASSTGVKFTDRQPVQRYVNNAEGHGSFIRTCQFDPPSKEEEDQLLTQAASMKNRQPWSMPKCPSCQGMLKVTGVLLFVTSCCFAVYRLLS